MGEVLLHSMETPQTPDATGRLFAVTGNLLALGDRLSDRPADSLLRHASFLVQAGDDIANVRVGESGRPIWHTGSPNHVADGGDPASEGPMRWRQITIEHPTDDGRTWLEIVQMRASPVGPPEVTGYTWGFWASSDHSVTPDAKLVVAKTKGPVRPDTPPISADVRHHQYPERIMGIHVPTARRAQIGAFGLRVVSAATGELLARDLAKNGTSTDWPYQTDQPADHPLVA